MKKLCRRGTVHPSPGMKPDDQFLSLLPVAILSLVAALSAEDREVLAYLISNSSFDPNSISSVKKNKTNEDHHHSPLFFCDCFCCYTSYWVRWDSSPNRQLIHEIIDAFEDSLEINKKKKKKKDRRKRSEKASVRVDSGVTTRLCELSSSSAELVGGDSVKEGTCGGEETVDEKGSLGKLMSLISQKIFGVWG